MRPDLPATPGPPATDGGAARCAAGGSTGCTGWVRLRAADRCAVLVGVVVIALVTVPRLPPGICYGDPGDLQLASATLGIAHPPGYTGYVTLGHLLTLVPGVDPAYMVSLGVLAAGILAVVLGMLMQIRLGLNPWMAAAIGVALVAEPHVKPNLGAPEVYAPTLAFLAAAAYLLLKYSRVGRRRELLLAALLFGVALANRPPVAFALPFFVVAWLFARPKHEASWRVSLRRAAAGGACLLLPAAYAFGFLWVRDTPAAPYNYIEQYDREWNELPDRSDGPAARLRRIEWQASAAQFRYLMGNDWSGVRSKLRWLRHEVDPGSPISLGGMAGAVLLGMVVVATRSGPAVWLLVGMIAQSLIFVCAYRIYGQAADLLPMIWAGTVAAGMLLAPLFPRRLARPRLTIAAGLLAAACGWTLIEARSRPSDYWNHDATAFVEAVDLGTFPAGAVICSSWGTSPPLWYAQHVLTGRDDIRIINASSRRWQELIGPSPDRPVFYTDSRNRLPPGHVLTPYRKLWRLERADRARAGRTSTAGD